MVDSQRGAELAIIISYSTSATGTIALLKTPTKLNAPRNYAYAYHVYKAQHDGPITMIAKPMKTLKLHYPMTQY